MEEGSEACEEPEAEVAGTVPSDEIEAPIMGTMAAVSMQPVVDDMLTTSTTVLAEVTTCKPPETNVRPQIRPPTSQPANQPPVLDESTVAATTEVQHAARELITRATSMVASSLREGQWPSSYRSLRPEAINARDADPNSNLDKHEEHMTIVGASLMQYARDVLVPTFLAAKHANSSNDDRRIVLGTLILLREVLILNSGFIFRLEPDVYDDGGLEDKTRDLQSEDMFVAKILATSIILCAIESLEAEAGTANAGAAGNGETETLEKSFLRVSEAYDNGDDEFIRYMRIPMNRYFPVGRIWTRGSGKLGKLR